ncbi:MAG: aminotransferase class IV [Myxococcota bacterium]|nr:aminotransferase class IV [Myxococcota bacterium]
MQAPEVDRLIWLDGEFVPWQDATVHVLAHSVQRGSLVFDYMSVHETPRGACVFRLELHVARFFRSCELVGLELRRSQEEIAAAILATVRRNPGAKAVKASAYLPSCEVDVIPQDDHVAVAIAAYDPYADLIQRKSQAPLPKVQAVRLWIEKERRNRRDDIMPPQAKVSANYASPMVAKAKARAAGYDEIVLVDEEGNVAEGPTTNLFLVDEEGTLVTPPAAHVLLGVTRASVLELAKALGIAAVERSVTPDELRRAAEAFLTGTTAGVWPVTSVDGEKLGDGEIGPVSRRLKDRFREVSSGEDPDFVHWLAPVEEA